MQNCRGGKSHCKHYMPSGEGLGTMMTYCNLTTTTILLEKD